MSSSKSEVESESESKKERKAAAKKDPKALTMEELEENMPIQLEETETIFTFILPSVCFKTENEKMKIVNRNYREYMQKRIGSDNFIARPVQTFNFQHKKIAESVEKPANNDIGVFASAWDIEDVVAQEVKTEYEILQEDIKNKIEREYTNFLIIPFSTLPTDKEAIEIHDKFPVPGAAEYMLKQKDTNNKSRKHGGLASGTTGLAQISTSNNRQT